MAVRLKELGGWPTISHSSVEEISRLHDTTPLRERRVMGFALSGTRPFRIEKSWGFGGHLLSVADKLIPYYRRSRLLITRSSQLSTPRTGNFSVLQIEPAYVLEFISV